MKDTLRVVRVAHATTDVRAAAREWRELYGAGPFFVRVVRDRLLAVHWITRNG